MFCHTSLIVFAVLPMITLGFSISIPPVSSLLSQYAASIATLKEETAKIVPSVDVEPYSNDVFYLRYCVEDFDSDEARVEQLKKNLQWRIGDGKAICDSAQKAVARATAEAGKWNNDPVQNAAPNADKINKYITPHQSLTTTTNAKDLLYCVRAGKIDDVTLMESLDSSDEMVDFFVYCKEVNACTANLRSLENDRLTYLLTVNDLAGVKLIGGDASFRTALSESSKITNDMYPSLMGPTLMLNLPRLLGALVKLFTPLFPEKVRARLKFASGPLQDVDDLMDISYGGPHRQEFLKEVDKLVYDA